MKDVFIAATLKLDKIKAPANIDVVVYTPEKLREVKEFYRETTGFKYPQIPFQFQVGGRQFTVRYRYDGEPGQEITFMVPLDSL